MSAFEDILKLLEIGATFTENMTSMQLVRDEKIASRQSANDTLKLSNQIENMNRENREMKSQLKQNLNMQEKEYKAYEKTYKGYGLMADDYSRLNDADITDAGFDWLKDTEEDGKRRLFQSLSDLTTTDMTIERLEQISKKNNLVLDKLGEQESQYVGAEKYYDLMDKDLGIKNMRDESDAKAWLNAPSKDNKDITNRDALTSLELLAYESGLPAYLKEEKLLTSMDVPKNYMIDLENTKDEEYPVFIKMSDAEKMSADPSKFLPAELYGFINKEIAKDLKDEAIKAKDKKSRAIADVNLSRGRVKAFKKEDDTKGTKYGKFELTSEDFYGDPKYRAKITGDVSDTALLSELDVSMLNLYKFASEHLDDTSKLPYSFADFQKMDPGEKSWVVKKLLSINPEDTMTGGQSLLSSTGEFKTEIWDFWKGIFTKPGYGGLGDDDTQYTKAALNSFRDDINTLIPYLEGVGLIKEIIPEEKEDFNMDFSVTQ